MKAKTLSAAKNAMRRAVDDLLDPPPSAAEQTALRRYFGDACAYCGAPAPARSGHIDHADPSAGKALGNLVLACSRCNGDEKRELPWREFLRLKWAPDSPEFDRRATRIERWQAQHPRAARPDSEDLRAARADVENAISTFEQAFGRLRKRVRAARR